MNELISRITILAVGVEKYDHMKRLWGPRKDVEQLRSLLTENTQTALFDPVQFREFYDPTVSDLAKAINEYTLERSAGGDILIFYFSGHGVPIGRDDFGFCTTDTVVHPVEQAALPLTVVKYSELIRTIDIANIVPVIIIDACYSGVAGRSLLTFHQSKLLMACDNNCIVGRRASTRFCVRVQTTRRLWILRQEASLVAV